MKEALPPVAVTEPIIMEVLAGTRDDRREANLRRLQGRFEMLPRLAPHARSLERLHALMWGA